jgi:hypothetical protein
MAQLELLADTGGPYCMLSAREAFEGLNTDERIYAYHMLRFAISLYSHDDLIITCL